MTTVEELNTVVTGLTEGKKYVMRVAAQNEVGVGEFTEIHDVVPKCPFGESLDVS